MYLVWLTRCYIMAIVFVRWWGVARHFNYLGEIIQALALALPSVLIGSYGAGGGGGGGGILSCMGPYAQYVSLLYPLYYILLFVPRQMDDDVVCAKKYGEAWEEYVRTVPYRICPGVW
jgi:Delta14-sterol reductase